MPKRTAKIAFVVAERINNKKLFELGMAETGMATRLITGFYDPATRTVSGEGVSATDGPVPPYLMQLLEEGNGVALFAATSRYYEK